MSTSVNIKSSSSLDKGMLRYLNEPKCFAGGNDYEEATTWLDRMARLQAATRMSDEEILFVAGDHLVEKAATWWKVAGKKSTDWKSFEEAFKDQYLADREGSWWRQLQTLKQGPKDSIDDVAFRMQELFDLLGNKNHDIQVSMFLDAIDPTIAFEVDKDVTPSTLRDARARAKQVERSIQRYGARPGPSAPVLPDRDVFSVDSRNGYGRDDLSSAVSTMFSLADKLEKLTINLVRANDGMAQENAAASVKPRRGLVCFFCDEEGHKKYDCPKYLARQEEVTGVRTKNANPLLNEQVEIKLVDTVREEAFCDTGEVYVKRRAEGPPSVANGPGRVAKRIVTGGGNAVGSGPGNLVAPLPPSGVYGGAQGNFSADIPVGAPGPSGTLGGTVVPNGQGPAMMGNAHGGVLQNNGMPGGNGMSAHGIPEVIGVNATGGRAINNGGSREVLPSGVIPNKPVKKRAPRKKARRLPVKLRGGRTIWDILDQCKADITATELIALDVKAQKDMVDGIRFLRENKRKLRKPVEAMEVDQGTGVDRVGEAGSATSPAVVNVVDQDWETEDSLSDEASTDLSSMYFEDDGSDDDQASMVSETDDGVSVYCYPYNLQRMKVSSPLRGAIMINDKPVEVVFDTGASVSVIRKGLVDSLGLVPNGDTLPLTGFDNKKGPSSPIVMDVPIRIAGKLRPEHMCIQPTGNDNLCLLGIPWFQAYGIEIDVVNSCVKIPTTSGMVKLQAYTTHLPVPVASMSGGGVGGVVFPVVNSNVSTAATMGSDRQVYMVDASQHHCDNYEEDLLPVGEPIKEEIKFDAENITMGVPDELVEVIERYKNCFSEVLGLGRVKNYVMDVVEQ
ncbi:hypothetical protein RO3G_04025 [Rhizopus delemar RA 99-880]|uniref:CCHC-type domain-containing protein n=1 Tax=Rhizopus delemar (strain RA 99-880 / ATCC MYA-4621 / FGSC 9543 / NRRL 43880) TaxID=246409 RepID=I1BSZ0_RHIO9|nr:hypothetical protein RO3G_04025 [Rhizopus delemar RA 99-880]|eukprot:EIE79320.1 hypothetical protein RO3G_04025 [Rhizopus delemar RA 99-880]